MTDKAMDILAHADYWQDLPRQMMPRDIVMIAEMYARNNVGREGQKFRRPSEAERKTFTRRFRGAHA